MNKNKFLIFIFIFMFLSLAFFSVKVDASTPTSDLFEIKGAQVRTSGTPGIRFVVNVDESYDKTNVSDYGVVLAYGETSIENMLIGGETNGKVNKNAQVKALSQDNTYSVTLINIPEDMFGQKVTARAYLVDNGETIYADSVSVRSLGQVTLAAKADGNTSELMESILTIMRSQYKNVYTDPFNNVYLASSIYETNPAKLEEEFVKDWNKKFGTSWTQIDYETFRASAIAGTTPLANDKATDCSGTNLYAFFNTDESMKAKWSWFLNYLLEIGSTKVHPCRQINALIGNGTASDEYGSDLWLFKHICASISNFFNSGSVRDANNDITFIDSSFYELLESHNNVIYAIDPALKAVDSEIQLAQLEPSTGYEFVGYTYHDIECKESFNVVSDTITLTPQFTPIDYVVKFYDGENEINGMSFTYNIETKDFNLPSYGKEGYVLKGWYTTPTFEEGTQVTSIVKGTTGEKIFYAKMVESSYTAVDVTLDPVGGTLPSSEILANSEPLHRVKLFRYDTYSSGGYDVSLYSSTKSLTNHVWWNFITLNKTDVDGLYVINQVVAKNSNVTAGSYDYLITWHSALTDTDAKTALSAIFNDATNYVGKHVILEGIPTESTSTGNIIATFVADADLTKSITKSYIDPETLPTVVKTGYKFLGWKSSVNDEVVNTYPGYMTNPGAVTYTAQYVSLSESLNETVTFDYNGGVTEALYKKYGTSQTTLVVDSYNGSFWTGTNYTSSVFVSTSANDPKATFSTRVYIGKDDYTGLYKVVGIINSGTTSSWAGGAEYVITLSGEYAGTNDDNFNVSNISVGSILLYTRALNTISSTYPSTITFYNPTISTDEVTENVNDNFVIPTPSKVGYTFAGWEDAQGNIYDELSDFAGVGTLVVTAKWAFEDTIIGSFETNSWVSAGNTIKLNAKYLSNYNGTMTWKSETPSIATVDQNGVVTGVSEGLATITVCDSQFTNIDFTFYVTVFASDPTGILKLIAESNNTSIFTKYDLGIGAGTPAYYYDAIGSVSQLLFEDYVVHKDFYLSSPSNKSTLTGSGKGGIDFITVHYAADMPYSANYSLRGGYNLASYNKSCNTNGTGASWHYSTGNDGVWYCQNTAYGAWHAGTSKTMKWYSTGVTTSQVGTDVYTTDVTIKSDNYFYIKGVKTNVTNTTGYSYTKLNGMGAAVKLVGNEWYIGGVYYNTSYKYISSLGGNCNSVGIETSVREASDLWLTWQYTAQLCANLLIQFELPIQRLVGHHFFSGKWCPQPMLENDLEIWYVFVDMVAKEMEFFKNYSSYSISMTTNSSHINSKGRVTSLPTYDECVTYTVTYKTGSTTKTVTLSTILPGTIND